MHHIKMLEVSPPKDPFRLRQSKYLAGVLCAAKSVTTFGGIFEYGSRTPLDDGSPPLPE